MCLPLGVVNVSLVRTVTGSSLSSIGITRLHWYYATIRLPNAAFGFLACYRLYTILFIKKKRPIGSPELPYHINVLRAKVSDSREVLPFLPLRKIKCCFLLSVKHQPSRITNLMELYPFNHLAFGPQPSCLRLKFKVTFIPPRLATSEWLVLSRRESHPLYDTT
jgi:hypothetical protein